jgi:hypothetical protein
MNNSTPARAEDLQMSDTTTLKQIFLSMLNNGEVTEDKVGPHGDLLNEFPVPGTPTRLAAVRRIKYENTNGVLY